MRDLISLSAEEHCMCFVFLVLSNILVAARFRLAVQVLMVG